MKYKVTFVASLTSLLLISSGASNAATTFDNEAAFLGAVGLSTTYDFETGSGFPTSGSIIGLYDGINFDAKTYTSLSALSGSQTMTGSGSGAGTFTPATLTFAPGTTGIGFYALDLTVIGDEVIRVSVDFLSGPDQTFDVGLDAGDPEFTPKYFGVYDEADSILSITLFGTEAANTDDRAWLIDDLSVASAVPVPAAIWLFGSGLIGLVGYARRKKS